MDFVRAATSGSGASANGLSSDHGPILYTEPNRTSAIEDIRSVIIYISFATLLLGFLIILPGIRHDKLPTILCIPTSLIVTCIIFAALTGTTWHVGEAPISAAYKAFSKDRIQGELSVKIGLHSVNITLNAHKYFILHATHGPIMMDNRPPVGVSSSMVSIAMSAEASDSSSQSYEQISPIKAPNANTNLSSSSKPVISQSPSSSTSNNLDSSNSENPFSSDDNSAISVDGGLNIDEPFAIKTDGELIKREARLQTNQGISRAENPTKTSNVSKSTSSKQNKKRSTSFINDPSLNDFSEMNNLKSMQTSIPIKGQKYSLKRVNVDINYNERFYWIEPNQMRQEHHNALERGLPYPILTVVEYLSHDEAGFSWSRQYRLAGYYSYILLSLSLCTCALMFLFHCAAPEYAIYTLQIIGLLLLFTNFTYAMLVPRGEQKLVIPFEGQSLSLDYGFDYWLVLGGGKFNF